MENQTHKQEHSKMPEFLVKLKALEDSLLTIDPKMPMHLKEIHKYLIQFEELAHLLTEEQIAIILEGQQRQVGLILAEETKSKKSNGGGGKIKGSVSASDL